MITFNYTTGQAKECINETEKQLRDLISTVFSSVYGLNWEDSTQVWDEITRRSLEERRSMEQGRFPNQQLSDRLIDFADILHLGSLLQRQWSHFERIFGSQSKTAAMFDMLQNLRNPLMHSRPGLLPHQLHLCLGICGEFLLAVENWRQGYTHQVKEYRVLFRFFVYPQGEDEQDAQLSSKHLAEQWLDDIVQLTGGKLEEKSAAADQRKCLLKIREGHVKIDIAWNYRGFDGSRYFRATDITVTTGSIRALEKVLETSKHPYWYLSWILKDDLDISIIISRISDLTGEIPANSTYVSTATGERIYRNASYRVGGSGIRISLFRAQQNSPAEVCFNFEDPLGKGFYQAHRKLSVEKVLSVLYGELAPAKVHQLLREACTM